LRHLGGLLEGPARDGLHVLVGLLLLGTVEHQEEGLRAQPHAGVQIGLRALDVIVEVITEQVHRIDGVLSAVLQKMVVEEYKGNEALILAFSDARDALEFSRSLLLGVSDGGSVGDGLSGVGELLKEDLRDDDVVRVPEVDREDDDGSVAFGLEYMASLSR